MSELKQSARKCGELNFRRDPREAGRHKEGLSSRGSEKYANEKKMFREQQKK